MYINLYALTYTSCIRILFFNFFYNKNKKCLENLLQKPYCTDYFQTNSSFSPKTRPTKVSEKLFCKIPFHPVPFSCMSSPPHRGCLLVSHCKCVTYMVVGTKCVYGVVVTFFNSACDI